jgi:hexulose-6-phosphate isomerase
MRKAINYWAFTPDKSLEQVFALAKDAGFEGVELTYDVTGPITAETSDARLAEIRALAQSMGLALPTVATGVFWGINPIAANAAEREQAKSHIRHMLRIAHHLGAGVILVVPGVVGPFLSGPAMVEDYEAGYEMALANMRELASDAKRWQVIIGVENVWNRFLVSPIEMREFVDAVGSPYVAAYFDVGNVMRTGYPQHWIKILGQRIKAVHFKDFKCEVGTLNGFVELLQGDVDYGAVMAAFRAVGYDGWVTVEQFPTPCYPDAMIYRAAQAADVIIRGK